MSAGTTAKASFVCLSCFVFAVLLWYLCICICLSLFAFSSVLDRQRGLRAWSCFVVGDSDMKRWDENFTSFIAQVRKVWERKKLIVIHSCIHSFTFLPSQKVSLVNVKLLLFTNAPVPAFKDVSECLDMKILKKLAQ